MAYKGLLRFGGVLCVGILFAAVVWGVVAAPPGSPFLVYIPVASRQMEPFSAYTGLITSDRDGDDDVYLITADGQNLRARTVNGNDDNNPQWSPDASRFLFEQADNEDDALYVADTAGGPEILLAGLPGDDFNPSWSPDGQLIAFINRDATGLYLVPSEGGAEPQQVATNVNDYAWSPVDNALLLTTVRNDGGQYLTDLFVLTDMTLLTPTLLATDIQNYKWSPDGKWVVFTATRSGDDEVFVSSLNGQAGYQVTTNDVDDMFAGWTEGGASVLITRDTPDGRQLYVVDSTGENEEPIAVAPGDHYVAGIRSDGQQIVYGRQDSDVQYLYVQPVRGGAPTLIGDPLCTDVCGYINVSWSSDHERLAYQTFSRTGNGTTLFNIYLARFDTPMPTYALFNSNSDTPAWLPGTHTLVYYSEISSRNPAVPFAHNIDTGQRYPLGADGERVQVHEWRLLNPDDVE